MKLIFGLVFLFCIGMIVFQVSRNLNTRKALLSSGKVTNAMIIEVNESGAKYKSTVCYEFHVEYKTYKDCKQYSIHSGTLKEKLPGKISLVIYDSLNPNVNQILLFQDDFESFDVDYPDSLRWIENSR